MSFDKMVLPADELIVRLIKRPPRDAGKMPTVRAADFGRLIFVTDNSVDFIYDAVEQEFSIIATELVTKEPKSLASIVSRALIDFSLWSKPYGWILRLHRDGNHDFQLLPK